MHKFHQEYPITPEEAFISSGNCVFNTENIQRRLSKIDKPLKTGYFKYEYDDTKPAYGTRMPNGKLYPDTKITNIQWVNDPKGYINIYEVPNTPEVVRYAIGGDTSGSGTDYNIGQVLNTKTLNQCAVLRLQTDSDLYAKQMYCLGMYYNQALIGIENNFDSYPIKELERLGYPQLYVEEKMDTYQNKLVKRYGFRTDMRTRPEIIDYLKQIVRDNPELLQDRDTLKEMLEFVYNDQGRPEAQEGSHDDLVMALAIAYRILTQAQVVESVIRQGTNEFFRDTVRSDKGKVSIV